MNHTQAISLYQPMLHKIAYNMLKCQADAEDVVQDTFLKWLTIDPEKVQNVKAYLITAVMNNCINHLNALKKKKEAYFDQINVQDFLDKFKENEIFNFDLQTEVGVALGIVHAKLEPIERAVFVLREMFGYDYDTLQEILEKKTDNCRQIFSRARKKLQEESDKIQITLPNKKAMMDGLKDACNFGNASAFIQVLKQDISAKFQ